MCVYDTQSAPLKDILKIFLSGHDQYQVPLGCLQNVQEKLNKISFEMMSAEFENLFQVLPTRQLHVQSLQQAVKYVPVCLLLTLNIYGILFYCFYC